MTRNRDRRERLGTCALAVSITLVAALTGLAPTASAESAPGTVTPAADAVAASTELCATLLTMGYCELTYADHPDATTFVIPEGIDALTVILSGGSGEGEDGRGRGGVGAAVTAVIYPALGPADRALTVWLGGEGQNMDDPGQGWSDGGEGNSSSVGSSNGGAGGGSSGLAWAAHGHDDPLIVAAGGGGAGHDIAFSGAEGGAGGSGGSAPRIGSGTSGAGKGDGRGTGGDAAGSSHADGERGHGRAGDEVALFGAGGGGGGYTHGGGGGYPGVDGYDTHPGAGGGGGAGDSFAADSVGAEYFGAAAYGAGTLKMFVGRGNLYECIDSDDSRLLRVPGEVASYGFIAVGGAGQWHTSSGAAGTGAMASGVLDVTGISLLEFWVACNSANHQYSGYGRPGNGGGSALDGHDGRDGGAATMIATAVPFTPLIAAGGGGGGGGDQCGPLKYYPLPYCGGIGGSGGGNENSRYVYDGRNGVDSYGHFTGGSGGEANSNTSNGASTPDGGKGEHAGFSTGGGGGGGAGYPRGGSGGHQTGDYGGGGGGAGGSYLSSRVSFGSIWASGLSYGEDVGHIDGFIRLFPFSGSTTELTVRTTVTGSADSYAHAPFTIDVNCILAGKSMLQRTITLQPAGSHTFEGVAAGSECTVVEPGAGGASAPAPRQTVTMGTTPVTVTVANEFAATSFDIAVSSTVRGEGGNPVPGAHIPLGELAVHASCTLAGQPIALPAPVSGGELTYVGDDTWAPGGKVITIAGVPVGAECTAKRAAGNGATSTSYAVDGAVSAGDSASFTLGPDKTTVTATDTYQLAPLTVTKAADGDSDPPPDELYSGTVACRYHGGEVTLPASASFSLAVGTSQRVHGLPVGARCTITETDRGTAVGTTYTPSRTVLITADSGAAVTITNTFDSGSLLVSIGTSGAGAGWANTSPAAHVVCTIAAETVLDETFTTEDASGGWKSYAVDGGAACTATETVDGGADSVSYVSDTAPTPSESPVTVTVPANGSATLNIDNRFTAAPLTVSTTVSGAGAQYAFRPTTVTVDQCTFNGAPIEVEAGSPSVSFTLAAHGGSGSIPELVTGASCAVTESDAAGATSSTYVPGNGDPSANLPGGGLRVTINEPADGAATSVAIDNRFDLAPLSVAMTVDGDAAWAANAPFEVSVQCTFQGAPVARLGPDGIAVLDFTPDGTPVPTHGSAALQTLSVGAECQAIETVTGGATRVTYDPADSSKARSAVVNVHADGSTIGADNDFAAAALTTDVVLDGNDAADHRNTDFHFEAFCTFNGRRLPAPPSDPTRSEVFVLTGGEAEVYSDLPVGAECTVHEFDTHHATDVTPSTSQTVTLGVDDARLTFRNVFEVTALTVTEVLTGAGAETYGSGENFTALVTCVRPGESGGIVTLPNHGVFELSAVNGYTATFDGPVGVDCRVAQSPQMATTQVLSAPVRLRAGEHHMLQITSEYLVAPVTVAKTAHGDFSPTQRFAFRTQCVWPSPHGDPAVIPLNDDVPGTFDVRSGRQHMVEVLQGADCSVTETDAAGAVRVVIETDGVGVSTDGRMTSFRVAPAATIVTVTNFMPGSLPVTGAEVTGALIAAAVLIALGLLAFAFSRLRRRHQRAAANRVVS